MTEALPNEQKIPQPPIEAEPTEAACGIVFSGCIYCAFRFAILVVYDMQGIVGPSEIVFGLLGFIVLCIAGVVALIPVTLVCVGLTGVVAYTTLRRPPWPPIAVAAGGLTGFACTAFVFVPIDETNWTQHVGQVLLGPVLATVFGQLGAALFTIHPQSRNLSKKAWLRFDILQVLIATAWAAGILTLLKWTNLLGAWSASIFGVWLAYQTITMALVLLVVSRVRGNA